MQIQRELYIKSYRINWFWAFIHDVIAHPLLGLTGCANWAVAFHDYSGNRSYQK